MTNSLLEKSEIYTESERLTDDDGIERPVFQIAGKKVAFRTRQETPSFISSGQRYHIASEADATPLIITEDDNPEDFTRFAENSEELTGANVLEIVTATPEGLVGAAIELGGDDEQLFKLEAQLHAGEYSEQTLHLIDNMAAALNFDDSGEKLELIDTAGHALILEALLGNEQANKSLDRRREAMYALFEAQRTQQAAKRHELSEKQLDIESIDPRKVVLVHSTSHGVILAEDGSTVLRPMSAFAADKFPRSTIHFTPNGQVTSHYNRQNGSENVLIVSNFAEVIKENDTLPTAMSTADTFFSLNPGQSLELPNVRVVRGVAETDDGQLIFQDGKTITYKESPNYSDEEKANIEQLARKYGVLVRVIEEQPQLNDALREVALRKAMEQKGAERFVEIGAHYTFDEAFQQSYNKLAGEIGATVALHTDTGDSTAEDRAGWGIAHEFSKKADSNNSYWTFSDDTTIQAVRQVFASGYIPARPFSSSAPTYDDGPWV